LLQGFFLCGRKVRKVILSGVDLQRQTLRLYGELVARRESWAGQLVFACGKGASATGLPAAVSIAGGTSLLLDSDTAAVKSVFRAGGVDFVVNTLDEALRVLKNEIRKHQPVSVTLLGAEQPALDEMAERGVVPDLQVILDSGIKFPGSPSLKVVADNGLAHPSEALESWLAERGWSEAALVRETVVEMRDLDERLLALVQEPVRRTWVQRIGHYQRVSVGGARVVWLTESEQAAFEGQ
jgi:urocanate hydratase